MVILHGLVTGFRLVDSGGSTNGYGAGNNTKLYVPNWSAFTVNTRKSTTDILIDKNA